MPELIESVDCNDVDIICIGEVTKVCTGTISDCKACIAFVADLVLAFRGADFFPGFFVVSDLASS